ncbi:MAG: GtrA family protein [Pseudomonadota bacterium]
MKKIMQYWAEVPQVQREFILFLLCGGTAATANIISRYVFFFILTYSVSIVLAYIVGMVIAFTLFKIIVFRVKEKKDLVKEVISFTLVNILGMLLTLALSTFLAELFFPYINFTFYPYDVAHILGVMAPVITSYFLHKHFTFARKRT